MKDAPRDRSEFWIRFLCSFLVFGLIILGLTFLLFDVTGLSLGIVILLTLAVSWFCARNGDSAWQTLARLFSLIFIGPV